MNILEDQRVKQQGQGVEMVVDYIIKMKEEVKFYAEEKLNIVKFLQGIEMVHGGQIDMIGDDQVMDQEMRKSLFVQLGLQVGDERGIIKELGYNTEESYLRGDIKTRAGNSLTKEEVEKLSKPIIWPVWLENWAGYGRVLGLKIYFNLSSLDRVALGSKISTNNDLNIEVEGDMLVLPFENIIAGKNLNMVVKGSMIYGGGRLEGTEQHYNILDNWVNIGRITNNQAIEIKAGKSVLVMGCIDVGSLKIDSDEYIILESIKRTRENSVENYHEELVRVKRKNAK